MAVWLPKDTLIYGKHNRFESFRSAVIIRCWSPYMILPKGVKRTPSTYILVYSLKDTYEHINVAQTNSLRRFISHTSYRSFLARRIVCFLLSGLTEHCLSLWAEPYISSSKIVRGIKSRPKMDIRH